MHAWLAAAVLVTGLVTTSDDVPLPGCTVTLTSASYSATTVANEKGTYAFRSVPPGAYEITFHPDGLRDERQRVTVREGEHVVPPQILALGSTQEIVMSCGWPCDPHSSPATRWDRPACAEYDLDTSLIDAMKGGDRSARELLLERYARTDTWFERHRLAGALLRRVSNDGAIWSELFGHAKNAVRFATSAVSTTPEFEQWCAKHRFPLENYWSMAYDAFIVAGEDSRAHPLLLEALRTDEFAVVYQAIYALGAQHDESSLPAIEEAIQRFPAGSSVLAQVLGNFQSERADAMAMKYLDENDREVYVCEASKRVDSSAPCPATSSSRDTPR
ncbi:MAG TPA: carboxypeptidase regulatory-like domain-containing protein [Thermoanaerobaculia bacterium]|nr:carboxypeptidase regulatory-like domain-containing protein [Thermoanaerobaculia bacterium]